MTDKELLELAAKAGGVVIRGDAFEGAGLDIWCGFMADVGVSRGVVWNPLDDDGDAFRLALNLEIAVWRDDDVLYVGQSSQRIPADGNALAMARRAIVEHAAEVGKAMP